MIPVWLIEIAQYTAAGISLAVCLAVPNIWVKSIINSRDIERHTDHFKGIFEDLGTIKNDVSYMRGIHDRQNQEQNTG